MSNFIHKDLASGKWFELSLPEQMANIGFEVNRAITFHKRNDEIRFEKAFCRALELFDLTLKDGDGVAEKKKLQEAGKCSAVFSTIRICTLKWILLTNISSNSVCLSERINRILLLYLLI